MAKNKFGLFSEAVSELGIGMVAGFSGAISAGIAANISLVILHLVTITAPPVGGILFAVIMLAAFIIGFLTPLIAHYCCNSDAPEEDSSPHEALVL